MLDDVKLNSQAQNENGKIKAKTKCKKTKMSQYTCNNIMH